MSIIMKFLNYDPLRKNKTLNKSYKRGLSKNEIDRIINDSKTGNITANRKRIWNNIGLKSPSN